jgi:hypothetical protein
MMKLVEFSEAELVCRMLEAYSEEERPPGVSASDLLAGMDPDMRDDWLRVSRTVFEYWTESLAKAPHLQ